MSTNSWSITDTNEIVTKIALLEEEEKQLQDKLDKVNKIINTLSKLNDNPKDIDGTNLNEPRRMIFKISLIKQADILLL